MSHLLNICNINGAKPKTDKQKLKSSGTFKIIRKF